MVDGPDSAWRNRAPGPHRNTARQAMDGLWTEVCGQKTVKRPRQQPAHPQYASYWAPLTRKRHTMPHSAQSQHANYWAPRTRKRHQQEHRPQRPTESSDPTQHAKGRTGDRPGPRKGATTRRNVTQGGSNKKINWYHKVVWGITKRCVCVNGCSLCALRFYHDWCTNYQQRWCSVAPRGQQFRIWPTFGNVRKH